MKRFNYKVDADIRLNVICDRCPNADSRHTDDEGLCKKVWSVVDGLPVRCVGEWANDKIYYLMQYFQIFAKGMRKKWAGKLRYVEICSGPGRCCTRNQKEQDGSALSILKNDAANDLSELIFVDYSKRVIETLSNRIAALGRNRNAHAILGDYNEPRSILEALKMYSPDSLTLCFIDPTDCSVPFETIRAIYNATNGKCDFIISFFDGLDFHRNAAQATLDPKMKKLRDKYQRFLGAPDFFERKEVVAAAKLGRNDDLSVMFKNVYADRLSGMGLSYQDWKSVRNFYNVLFVSSNSRGLDFWKKATKYDPPGQPDLPGLFD